MKDLAILGGSFNPVHNGHIAMAASAHKMYGPKGIGAAIIKKELIKRNSSQLVNIIIRFLLQKEILFNLQYHQ